MDLKGRLSDPAGTGTSETLETPFMRSPTYVVQTCTYWALPLVGPISSALTGTRAPSGKLAPSVPCEMAGFEASRVDPARVPNPCREGQT